MHMNRRDFFQSTAACALAAAGDRAAWQVKAPAKVANLKLGTQHGDSDEILRVMAALGVNHICALPPTAQGSEDWSVDALRRKREHVESFGVKADALRLLHPTYIASSQIPGVMMGKSPERDREIDVICEKI